MKDYAGIATQYARDVVDGSTLACKWVKLACARHLRNLDQDAAGWRYTWNPELQTQEVADDDGNIISPSKAYRPADRACHFIELLPHIKGDWASRRETILLQPWQVFIVASIFGWVDRETLRRRFRAADLFVPRKNAKSTIAAGIGLYLGFVDGEFGAEIYSGATSEDQAKEVFTPAKLMVDRSPEFRARFGVVARASNISAVATNSRFEPVIGKPGDGASPSCAIVDEYHEHATEDLYDTMKTGMGARSQPLMLVITTSGDDISGPAYVHQETLQQILEGIIDDEQRFGIIYTIDQGDPSKGEPNDDWTTPEALIKANPNFGVSIDEEFLLTQQRDALRDPRKQSTFKTKHLNIWVQSANPWLNALEWQKAADKDLKIEDFIGENAWPGLDLANTTDIASRCLVFKRPIDGREHYYFFWRHYLPEAVIDNPENKHYQGWHKKGYITKTPGGMIDQDLIHDDLLDDSHRFPMSEVALDQWGSAGISAQLEIDGFIVVAIPMRVSHLSGPMKWIDGLLTDGRLHHNGDPVATWCINNVSVKPDQNDNWFPRKHSKAKKTDAAIAMIVATARAMVGADAPSIDDWLRSAQNDEPISQGSAVPGH